jgi:hypothetical protein
MEAEDSNIENEHELEPLRVQSWGYAESVEIADQEPEGEEVCVVFTAECGHTGAKVPLVDLLKHALVDHPEVVAQAYRELGREVPDETGEADSEESDDEGSSWNRYG